LLIGNTNFKSGFQILVRILFISTDVKFLEVKQAISFVYISLKFGIIEVFEATDGIDVTLVD